MTVMFIGVDAKRTAINVVYSSEKITKIGQYLPELSQK